MIAFGLNLAGIVLSFSIFLILDSGVERLIKRWPELPNKIASSPVLRFGITITLSLIAIAFALVTPYMLHSLAIISCFGWDEFKGGLHVVNKQDLLSNGEVMPSIGANLRHGLYFPSMILGATPLITWQYRFLSKKAAAY